MRWTGEPLLRRQLEGHRGEWELVACGRPVGSLSVRGAFRERIEATGPSGAWEFREHWSRLEISRGDGAAPVARYEPNGWGGGHITTASSQRYEWRRRGFWKPVHEIATDSGFTCLLFRPRRSLSRVTCEVVIEPLGRRIPELEALLFLGWRLHVQRRKHAH